MNAQQPQTIHLSDYTPYPYQLDKVELEFHLAPRTTRVLSTLHFTPLENDESLILHGEKLKLVTPPMIDGEAVDCEYIGLDHSEHADGMIIHRVNIPDRPFLFEIEVELNPEANTALEGLYMSNGMYCTQCEAEGFRKITYFPDRPDVMAPYRVRIYSDQPVQLSNGNPGKVTERYTEWEDPWPKPSYLFALVAGDLVAFSDRFTTMSGRDVALNIWVRPGDEGKCDYAMDALKRSMRWDEKVYGREYDLDVFNIVAVDDFNMGAMENKGLNIFNSKYVLASPDTATDSDYEAIEAIIAHEYFHNWTGNRITCRDWFQLCLKEGLTVFRDQQFSADMRGAAVQRIDQVLTLRARQFREDAGPLAHPVRPESFVEINNFYTATVYEKGAEVIGMLKRLVGDQGYAKALSLFFDRHDGDAATIEDWLQVFEDATGRDLSQFKRWYSQAGTPRLTIVESFENGTYQIEIEQETGATPGQNEKAPQVIPIAMGLLDSAGNELISGEVLELTEARQSFTFENLAEKPIPSLLRGFSAPVVLDHSLNFEARATLLAHDSDWFNRWEAGRSLTRETLLEMLTQGSEPAPAYLDALNAAISDDRLDPAFRALVLSLPSQDDMAQAMVEVGHVPDPSKIYTTRKMLARQTARHLQATLDRLYAELTQTGAYSPDAGPAGKRALRNTALSYLTLIDDGAKARTQYDAAGNMTDQLAAFSGLLVAKDAEVSNQFYDQWQADRLVMDKWFMMQVSHAEPEDAAATATALTEHKDFDWKNPNRFRSVIGGLTAGNPAGFHDPSGEGYRFLGDWLLRLDKANPQTAARMSTAFETWRRYDVDRQAMIKEELSRIAAQKGLSRDLAEMTGRMLQA